MAYKLWTSCKRKDRTLVDLPVAEHLSPETTKKIYKLSRENCVFILEYFRLKVAEWSERFSDFCFALPDAPCGVLSLINKRSSYGSEFLDTENTAKTTNNHRYSKLLGQFLTVPLCTH
jgi:hypothetical protein